MRIDHTHRPWLIFSVFITVLSSALYIWFAAARPNGPSGGSVIGLIFGSVGFAFMIFAGALALRKFFRSYRLGSAEFWMRGHLWLGSLAVLLIWYHGGGHFGGSLTSVLMILLYAVVISGILGAILQHYLPRQMRLHVGAETVHQRIPQLLRDLANEAQELAAACAAPAETQSIESWREQQMTRAKDYYGRDWKSMPRSQCLTATIQAAPIAGGPDLLKFFESNVAPFVRGDSSATSMRDEGQVKLIFDHQKRTIAEPLHPLLDELRKICEQITQLRRQRRMHWMLHGWLLVHVPLSIALLVLSAAHAWVALRFSW
jgi:hypothetical protein